MLHYLKDHADEVYPLLEAKGRKVREGVRKSLEAEGIRVAVTGIASLFQTHFPLRDGVTFNSPQAINEFTDIEKREFEFRIRMLNQGVHVMHGGGALSITHSDEDIEKIIRAAREVAREMRDDH